MLSYQHGYHAGNFADVVKHLALTRLMAYMTLKEKPLFYLETHAGKGIYDLKDKQAQKTEESKQGIQLLWPHRKQLPAIFHDYFAAINHLNHHEGLKFYPGSPALAVHQLRKQDRLYFCELHPTEFAALDQMPLAFKKAHVSQSDGIASLKSLLPPLEKRGLIFIDPSFEIKDEYKKIPVAIKEAYNHFATGIYCLWFPVVNHKLVEQLDRGMRAINSNALRIEFNLTMARQEGMTGCGLWILNPPYTLANEMKVILDQLKPYFNPGVSSYMIENIPAQ